MRAVFAFLAFMAATLQIASAQILSITTPPPARDFGYFPGDVFVRHVGFRLAPGTVLDTRSLPQPGPVSTWLDIRQVVLRGDDLQLEYQIFLSPEQVTQAEAPGFSVVSSNGARQFTGNVPGFTVSVSPFRHDLQPVIDPRALRPDHTPATPRVLPSFIVFAVSSTFALLSWAALIGPGLIGRDGPFSQAARRIRRAPADSTGHFLVLHRAFDTTAGARMLAGDIDGFLSTHARYRPLRGDVVAFFAASNAAFFDGPPAVGFDVRPLSRALARAERRG